MTYPGAGRADYLDLGNWNALCGECGRKRKASDLIQLPPGVPGSGLYVCRDHWNSRQPQDFVRGVPDNPTPPWVQPQGDLVFVDFPDYIVVEAYVPSDNPFGDDLTYGIATETDLPLLTE